MVSVVRSFVKLLAVALFVSVFAAGPALAKGPAKGGAVLAAITANASRSRLRLPAVSVSKRLSISALLAWSMHAANCSMNFLQKR